MEKDQGLAQWPGRYLSDLPQDREDKTAWRVFFLGCWDIVDNVSLTLLSSFWGRGV